MKKKRIIQLSGGVAAAAALATLPWLTASADASQEQPQTKAASFTDDFNGAKGDGVDSSKWTQETGDGVNNHERQYYTSGTDNASLDGDGHLVITAKKENPKNYNCWYGSCQYTSARLNTAKTFTTKYGHAEARMKIPAGQGMWPAFWMLGDDIGSAGWPNCGELDIMENVGKEPGTVHGTIHGPGYSGSAGVGAPYDLPSGQKFSDDFHTFGVNWSENKIEWTVDGKVYQTRTPDDVKGNKWVFDHPFDMILNLAVGGDWPGDPDGNTAFPGKLLVDYVHVTGGS